MKRQAINMEIICRGRKTGKTIQLIRMSAKTGTPIVVGSMAEKQSIKDMEKALGIIIPEPFTVSELKGGKYVPPTSVYVDNAECLLQRLLETKIAAITISDNDDELVKQYRNAMVNK